MGAHNHLTVVPNENAADERTDLTEYDADNPHDRYMWGLRAHAIRAGVISPRTERVVEE